MQRQKDDNEVNDLKAENRAIKQQLAELNALREEAAEARFLRNQLSELDPLRRKVAEMDVIKRQLEELNSLKDKLRELGNVNAQLDELNKLKAQLSQMNVLKDQLAELNYLKSKLAELSGVPSQLNELNNLRNQVSQINVLKQQIEELSDMKSNEIDAENLRRKINDLESLKSQYEQEIRRLRESQRRTETVEQNKVIEFKKTEVKLRNTGMDSKQLLFEDKPQQICVKGDIIHNTDELEFLTRKINKLNQRLTLNLLYKATADSDKASAFHNKCDEARSTLVLVETDKGKRFGGFTTCSWKGDCIDKKDEDAFVFSLDKMQIYENIPGEDAIGCYPKFGPIFLGCQIRIFDNAFSKGGTTFEKGLNFNTEEDFELTGGEREFNVRDIEVYEVIPQ
jgi:DNA repair exonuclease SbcCD ATPase subunit